jgi:hypothetical protein
MSEPEKHRLRVYGSPSDDERQAMEREGFKPVGPGEGEDSFTEYEFSRGLPADMLKQRAQRALGLDPDELIIEIVD